MRLKQWKLGKLAKCLQIPFNPSSFNFVIMSIEIGNEKLIAVIGDEVRSICRLLLLQDTVTGLLLVGIGEISDKDGSNYYIVDKSSSIHKLANFVDSKTKEIEDVFNSFIKRTDIGIIVINQFVGMKKSFSPIDRRYDSFYYQ